MINKAIIITRQMLTYNRTRQYRSLKFKLYLITQHVNQLMTNLIKIITYRGII